MTVSGITQAKARDRFPAPLWHAQYADERLDALLSITGRMDGFLYRCRNDPSYTMLYISDGVLTLSGYPPDDFLLNRVRDTALPSIAIVSPASTRAYIRPLGPSRTGVSDASTDPRTV